MDTLTARFLFAILWCGLLPADPLKTTVCEIVKHPETFDGKLVQVRALVDSGVEDLPAGVADESCGGALKFYMPDDAHFGLLLKSKGFKKLMKDVKKNPVVEATVSGWFRIANAEQKAEAGLVLASVEDVVVRPLPRVQDQKR